MGSPGTQETHVSVAPVSPGRPVSSCERQEVCRLEPEVPAPALCVCVGTFRRRPSSWRNYLVDPASSHMLVSKTKPCMSKYKPLHGETANGSLNQLWFLRSYKLTWITVVILELIHDT